MCIRDRGHLDLVGGVVDAAQHLVPRGPVDIAEAQPETPDDVGVQAFAVQHLGDVVDAGGVNGGGESFLAVSYTPLRAHETVLDLVCRLPLEKKNQHTTRADV